MTFDKIAFGLAHVGPDGRFLKMNPPFCRILGYTCEELMEMTIKEVTHHEDYDTDAALWQEVVDGKRDSYVLEKRYIQKSGRIVWVRLSVSLVADDEGKPLYSISAIQDITRRKEAEHTRDQALAKYEALLDALGHIVYEFDPAAGTLDWSGKMVTSLGFKPGVPCTLEQWRACIHPSDLVRFDAALDSAIKENRPIDCEYRCREVNAGYRWVHDRGAMVYSGGKPTVVQGMLRDITGLRSADEEERRLERRLMHNQKMESIGAIAGGVAHEFNNSLQVILGNATMGIEYVSAVPQAEACFDEIIKRSEKAAELCRKLLTYAGRSAGLRHVFDLGALVRENEDLLRVSIPKKLHFKVSLENVPLRIHADAEQIKQLLLNLVTNAAEATLEVGTEVRLRTSVVDHSTLTHSAEWAEFPSKPGTYAIIELGDDGVGIDRKSRSQIFDPFYTTKFIGRGLGLSAALGIVRSCAGGVRVESEPGRGTVVTVALPLHSPPV